MWQASAVSSARSPQRRCPLLQPLGWRSIGSAAREITCTFSPVGVGPPSVDELAWLCTDGHHFGCPRYRDSRRLLAGGGRAGAPATEGRA